MPGTLNAAPPEVTSRPPGVDLGVLFLLTTAPLAVAWYGAGVITDVAEIALSPSKPTDQWGTLAAWGKLYLASPVVLLCGCVSVLSPGILFVILIGRFRDLEELLFLGLASSMLILALGSRVVLTTVGASHPSAFFGLLLAVDTVLWGALAVRAHFVKQPLWPSPTTRFQRRCLWAALLSLVLLVVCLPKFYWENLNPDGVQVLECGRLLNRQMLPIWQPATTEMFGFPGVSTLTFILPVQWFVQLFGPLEISARLPILLYVSVLFFALLHLIEVQSPQKLRPWGEVIIALALATFVVTLGYSASYDPYCADIAQPAARATLLMTFFVGAISMYATGRTAWFVVLAALTFMTSPAGSLLLGFLGLITLVCEPAQRRQNVKCLAAAAATCILLSIAWSSVAGSSEHSISTLLRRMLFWKFTDIKRFCYLAVPCGILPIVGILGVYWQDRIGRCVALVCLAYFLFMYTDPFVVLHYFAPAMILPLVAFWRLCLARPRACRLWIPVVGVTTVACLMVSIPWGYRLDDSALRLGLASKLRFSSETDYEELLQRSTALYRKVFRYDWDIEDPSVEYGGCASCWLYYAQRSQTPDARIDFVAQPKVLAAPEGFMLLAQTDQDALYTRNAETYLNYRYKKHRTDFAAPAYALPRTTIFEHLGLRAHTPDIDLRYRLRPYLRARRGPKNTLTHWKILD